jgi:hypothetical protein
VVYGTTWRIIGCVWQYLAHYWLCMAVPGACIGCVWQYLYLAHVMAVYGSTWRMYWLACMAGSTPTCYLPISQIWTYLHLHLNRWHTAHTSTSHSGPGARCCYCQSIATACSARSVPLRAARSSPVLLLPSWRLALALALGWRLLADVGRIESPYCCYCQYIPPRVNKLLTPAPSHYRQVGWFRALLGAGGTRQSSSTAP